MLLKFALILVFSGLVLFVLSLRAASKQDFVAVERLIDGFSSRLLKSSGTQRVQLLFLSMLQSMGCLLLGSKTSPGDSDWEGEKEKVSARYDALEGTLGDKSFNGKTLSAEFAKWQSLRQEWALSLIQKNPLLSPAMADLTSPDQFTDFVLPYREEPYSAVETLTELPSNWDNNSWKELQDGAMRLGNLRWAFTDPALIEADLRSLLDQCTLIYQSIGPGYSLLRHGLDDNEKADLDKALTSWTESLGQCFFSAQTTLRLSRMAEAEAGRKEQAARCFQEIARALIVALNWLHNLEQGLFLFSLGAVDKAKLITSAESFQSLAAELRIKTEKLCQDIGDTISENWRVNEMIYGHPRGQDLVESMGLKCKGCYVAETESLRSASMVHDFKIETVLTTLTEPQ